MNGKRESETGQRGKTKKKKKKEGERGGWHAGSWLWPAV